MEWIEQLKQATVYDVATTQLGMQGGRLRSLGPCPACNADRRGAGDGRLPIGTGRDARGWQCHACDARGDVVELVALRVLGKSSAQAQAGEWAQLREWATARGLANPEATRQQRGGGGRKPRAWQAPATSVASLLGERSARAGTQEQGDGVPSDAPAQEAQAPGGRFGWHHGLAEECAAALWGDAPQAAQAREYLTAHRKLGEDVLRAHGVGLYVREGQPVVSAAGRPYVTIPLRDPGGRAVNVRFRSVPVAGTCDNCTGGTGCKKCKEYRVCSGRPMPLFGADRLLPDTSVPVLVTEGEFDVISMHQYGFAANVVSSTLGAKTPWRDDWLDLLEPYDGIVGLYDGDGDGEAGWEALVEKLGNYRCSRATLPRKDAGDCLATGVEAGVVERAVLRAQPMIGLAFRKADEFLAQLETLIDRPELLRGTPTGSQKLDQLLGGWRPGVVVVTGETGQGKTTFTTWGLLQQARQGHGVVVTSFEQSPIGTVQKLVRAQVGRDFTAVTREERRDAMYQLAQLPLYLLDHYGHLGATRVIEGVRYARRRLGARFFLIDHLGFLVDPDAEDERRAIEAVVRALAIAAKQMEVTIFLVVHPRNDAPKGRGYTRVTMQQLKGASAIRQDADDILVVVAEGPDTAKGRRVKRPWPQSRVYADKVRSEFGISGGDVALAYDPGSCTYADEWADTPAGRAGLLVPRRVQPRDPPADAGQDGEPQQPPRRRPPRGKEAAAGEREEDDPQQPLLGGRAPEPDAGF